MTQMTLITLLVQSVLVTDANIYIAAKDNVTTGGLTMAEYIERKRAIVDACNSLELYPSEYAKLEDALNRIPAADVAPVKHGRIIENIENGKMKRVFSCCGEDFTVLTMWLHPNYCPNCGAKMDGE